MAETHGDVMTFVADEALAIHTRVRMTAASGTNIVYADAGEQAIGTTLEAIASGDPGPVKLVNAPGTVLVTAGEAFAVQAVLYNGTSGVVQDTSSGTAIGTALEAATAAGDIIEMMPWNVIGTTAATTTVTDAGALVTGVTVEAVLAEFATHIQSAQHHIPLPLATWRAVDTNAIADITNTPATDDDYGGLLHAGSVPILQLTNGDTDSALRLHWAASDSNPIIIQAVLPPRIDATADIVVHLRAAMSGTTNTPTIASDIYLQEGDTKVEDASAAITGATVAEYTITFGNADLTAGDQTITIELTPGAHTTDALYVYATWIEYTGTTLTA